ncbi:MAG: hypothetical protein S0880_04965 [Actinomycetota bacterium]|nr:hypothetical protein [Actinomycetota bacterium]
MTEPADGSPTVPEPRPAGEHLHYELHEWALESRVMAASLLRAEGVPHAWEGPDVVVPVEVRESAESVLADVAESGRPALDPDADKVAYEIADWPITHHEALSARLDEEGIAHEWDPNGDLLVLEADEEAADEVFDDLDLEGLEDDDLDEDGLAAQDVLSDLFVACERLARDGRDGQGAKGLVDATGRAQDLARPFGFDADWWNELVGDSGALVELVTSTDADPDAVEGYAESLRGRLRSVV